MCTSALVGLSLSLLIFAHSTVALSAATGEAMQRRILVTGANQGIGLALTKQLVADHNCHVYLGARNAAKGADAVAEVKSTSGDSVELLNIDVCDPESVKTAAQDLSVRLPGDEKLYAIVNNAGAGFTQPPAEILDTNTRGPRRVVDSFLPHLDQSVGRIVNLGSGGGPRFFEGLTSDADRRRYFVGMNEDEIETEIAKIESSGDSGVAYRGSKALLACL
ncbi:hypothetical protein ACHAXT_003626 [Thalassiosira profunda]